jgi:transaldolase
LTHPTVLLDSAATSDATRAARLGYVDGLTTNPALMAREGADPVAQLESLLAAMPGTVFFQPLSSRLRAARDEGLAAHALDPRRVVLKLPATREFASLARELAERDVACALTGVYSAAQAIVAHQAGCGWVIPYFDRARRLAEGGEGVVTQMADVLARLGSDVRILAASIKSPDQAVAALATGAHAVTAPLDVLEQLPEHALTRDAVERFDQAVADAGLVAAGTSA